MNVNKAIIIGHVSQPPELRMTPSNQSVASMGVATNRTWTDKEGKRQEATEFHSIVLWGRNAEIASEFLMKGSAVLIEGRLETRKFTDRQNVERYKTEIICENLQLGQRPAAKAEDSMFPGKKPLSVPEVKQEQARPVTKPEAREPHARMPESSVPEFKPIFGEPEIKPESIPF